MIQKSENILITIIKIKPRYHNLNYTKSLKLIYL